MDGEIRVSQVRDTAPPDVKVILATKPSSKEVVLPNGLAVLLCKGLQHVLGDQVATTKLTDEAIKEMGDLRDDLEERREALKESRHHTEELRKELGAHRKVAEKVSRDYTEKLEALSKEKAASDDAHAKELEESRELVRTMRRTIDGLTPLGSTPVPPGSTPTTPEAAPHSAPPSGAQSPTSLEEPPI